MNTIQLIKDLCKEATAYNTQKATEPHYFLDDNRSPVYKETLDVLILCKQSETPEIPDIANRIIADIEIFVNYVSRPEWTDNTEGRKIIKQGLQKTFRTKYLLKDNELIRCAFDYIQSHHRQ